MEQENARIEEMPRNDENVTKKPYHQPTLTEYGSVLALTQGVGGTVPDPAPSVNSRGV